MSAPAVSSITNVQKTMTMKNRCYRVGLSLMRSASTKRYNLSGSLIELGSVTGLELGPPGLKVRGRLPTPPRRDVVGETIGKRASLEYWNPSLDG